MKKILLLTKTLLAAVLLCVGQNAWAEDVYTDVYQRTSAEGTNKWSEADVTDWGSVTDLAIDASSYFGFANTASAARDASYTISAIEKNAKVKYVVEWYVKSTNGGYGSMYSYLKLGNLFIRVTDNWKNNDIGFSTDAGATYCTDLQSKVTQQWVRSGNIVTVTAILNTANNVVESMTVVIDGTTYSASNLTTTSLSGANNKVIGLGNSSTRSGRSASLIKSITVSQCPQAVTEADYTINYQLSGTTVKTVAGTSVVDAEITADAAIDGTEEGYVGNHYLITAADAPSMTLVADAASNVLNVPVRAPYTATLNVTKTIGGVAQSPVVTNLTETDAKVCSWNYTYPMYVQKDGVYYVADETSSFGESGTFTDGETINKTVAYTNPDYSVVYFGEPNEVTGTNTAYSNGATGFITGGVTYDKNDVIRLGQLQAGTYRLITNITGDANRNLVVGDYTAGTESFPTELVTITTTGAKDETFTVDGTQLISISGKDQGKGKFNQSATLDYVLVKASSASATIGAKGYTTFSSSYPLNLAGISGGTAYKVITSNIAGTVVNPSAATGTIAAGEGLILGGEADATVTIPVAASGDAISGNLMVGCPTGATINKETPNYEKFYVLVNGDTEAKFANLTDWVGADKSVNIPASKAYLYIPGLSARSMSIVLGDNVTGVANVEAAAEAKAKEGKFIENGKLVIVKNGVKYNAAGAQVK